MEPYHQVIPSPHAITLLEYFIAINDRCCNNMFNICSIGLWNKGTCSFNCVFMQIIFLLLMQQTLFDGNIVLIFFNDAIDVGTFPP